MKRTSALCLAIMAIALLLSVSSAQADKIHSSIWGPNRLVLPGDSIDVWIYFTDRGYANDAALTRALERAKEQMLPRTLARRAKMRPESPVQERDLPVNEVYVAAVLQMGPRYRAVSRYINALAVRAPRTHLEEIAGLPFVASIRPVAKGRRDEPSTGWSLASVDPVQPPGTDLLDYGGSFAQLNQIGVITAHNAGYSGAGVLVCLLDTGFFTDHEALINQPVVAEWDFINNDPETQNQPGDPPSQDEHGTYTFSTLGGAHDGDLYGPAYGASFIIGKTENIASETPIEEDFYVAGLEWADSLGAQVVSTSLGYFDWYTFADLDGNTCVTTIGVDIAVANGIVCATAAGNERGTSWGHIIAPADADSVITVGAVNSSGVIASFSSPGPTYDGRIKPDVCARGVNTWCAAPWGSQPSTNYAGVSGTSLSTPLVGGACALMVEAHPSWTPMQIYTALIGTANNYSTPNNDYGWGIINVWQAINFNLPPLILQRHPEAGLYIGYQDSLLSFWVSAIDPNLDTLEYHWWLDGEEVYVGPDSIFNHIWSAPDTSEVKVVVQDARSADSATWTVQIEPYLASSNGGASALPSAFALHPNYPNPFNSTTSISFDLPRAGRVRLAIYDTAGRFVALLQDAYLQAGQHRQDFDAGDLASGIYFGELIFGADRSVIKMAYAK